MSDDYNPNGLHGPVPVEVLREPVQARGLIRQTATPFAAPVLDVDEEELAIGPPVDRVDKVIAPRPASELREGPWTLLLSTALQGASAAAAPLVEDALLRRSDAALSDVDSVRLRPLADQVALLETEYLSACTKYRAAEDDTPKREDWHNPQHLLEAMKVHERRMDRLQRGMRDSHERLMKAVQVLERARSGQDLGDGSTDSSKGTKALGVEVTQSGTGTSRVRVGAR